MILNVIISIAIFICILKTFFYGLYEIKQNENKLGGDFVIFISIIGLIVPITFIFL